MCSIFVCEGVLSPHSIDVEGITSVCPIFAIYYYFVSIYYLYIVFIVLSISKGLSIRVSQNRVVAVTV